MDAPEQNARLDGAGRPLGDEARSLVIGDHPIRICGLSREGCADLERRWGGFLQPATTGEPRYTVELRRGGPGFWLDAPQPTEAYRVEALGEDRRRLVSSYHFAIRREEDPSRFRVGITDGASEPLQRLLDNVLRVVTAHLSVEQGGFAMHAAGVLHEEKAWLFAGPSRAGKSTVARLLEPASCLGDDFGLVLPTDGGGWLAPAVPFDNSEQIGPERPTGAFPVAGIWRLHKASTTRVELPPGGRAVTSLMGCTAFSWAMPDLSRQLLAQVERFVTTGSFQHLHFTKNASLWSVLI